MQAPAHGQQLELRMCGYQTFGVVEDIDGVAAVTGHHGHTDARPPVQIMRTGLGGRHAEFALQLGDQGRVTDRFCLSERTSPSSTSNSSQPIHIGSSARESVMGPAPGW